MAKTCKHCGGTQFNVKLVGAAKVDLINDAFDLIEQGDINVDETSLVCAHCNQPVKMEDLLDAMLCTQCKQLCPTEKLVEVDVEGTPTIMCQDCYNKMSQPADLNTMSKEQLIAYIQQMQVGEATDTKQEIPQTATPQQAPVQQAPVQQVNNPVTQQIQQAPVQQAAPTQAQQTVPVQQTPAPAQTQPVETNIPSPNIPVEENTTGISVEGASFFNDNAPF